MRKTCHAGVRNSWPTHGHSFLVGSSDRTLWGTWWVFAEWACGSGIPVELGFRKLLSRGYWQLWNYGCATVETGRDDACMSIKQQPPRVKLHIPASHALGPSRVPRHTLLAAALYMTNATSRRKSRMERSGVRDGGSDLLRESKSVGTHIVDVM